MNFLNNRNCCYTIILFNFEQIKACGASGTGMQLVCQCFGHFRNFGILSPYRQTSIINVLSDTVTPFKQTLIINVLRDNVKFPFWLTSQTTAVCVAKWHRTNVSSNLTDFITYQKLSEYSFPDRYRCYVFKVFNWLFSGPRC